MAVMRRVRNSDDLAWNTEVSLEREWIGPQKEYGDCKAKQGGEVANKQSRKRREAMSQGWGITQDGLEGRGGMSDVYGDSYCDERSCITGS